MKAESILEESLESYYCHYYCYYHGLNYYYPISGLFCSMLAEAVWSANIQKYRTDAVIIHRFRLALVTSWQCQCGQSRRDPLIRFVRLAALQPAMFLPFWEIMLINILLMILAISQSSVRSIRSTEYSVEYAEYIISSRGGSAINIINAMLVMITIGQLTTLMPQYHYIPGSEPGEYTTGPPGRDPRDSRDPRSEASPDHQQKTYSPMYSPTSNGPGS